MLSRRRKSFTLLELMIAFVIMAILSAVAIPSLISIANNDRTTADQTSAIALADASYYGAVSADTSGSGDIVVNYLDGADQSTPIPFTSGGLSCIESAPDPTCSTPWTLGDGTPVYYVFGDPVIVEVNVAVTDGDPLPTLAGDVTTTTSGPTTTTSTTVPVTTTTTYVAGTVELAATLNTGQEGSANSVSCTSAGNCVAGGYYVDSDNAGQAFVDIESGGTWADATPIAVALNAGNSASINSVSCASDGTCTAVGIYTDDTGTQIGFSVQESDGTWSSPVTIASAFEVPAPSSYTDAGVYPDTLSCSSAGNCSAGGYYDTGLHSNGYGSGSNDQQGFVVSEVDGTWGTPVEVGAGFAADASFNEIASISCSSSGNCSAVGYYHDNDGQEAYAINEESGTWQTATPIAVSQNTNGEAQLNSVSCTTDDHCVAGGTYSGSDGGEAFVVTRSSSTWSSPEIIAVPPNIPGTQSMVTTVSCPSTGNCSLAGTYVDAGAGNYASFVADEVSGTWSTGQAMGVSLSPNGASPVSISCSSAGNCGLTGYFVDSSYGMHSYVASEDDGTWSPVQETAGVLNTGANSDGESVSCPSDGNCTAVGAYAAPSNATLYPYGASEISGTWSS
jgi:type II secretory pathway pseudopilin PulG